MKRALVGSLVMFGGLFALSLVLGDDRTEIEERPVEPAGAQVPKSGELAVQPAQSQATEIILRVYVSDMTDAQDAPRRSEIWVRGAGSWFPNLEFGGDVRDYPQRRIGTIDSLFWYPEGREGPEILVAVPITEVLCPQGCARDMVMLWVQADTYLASGVNFEEIVTQR